MLLLSQQADRHADRPSISHVYGSRLRITVPTLSPLLNMVQPFSLPTVSDRVQPCSTLVLLMSVHVVKSDPLNSPRLTLDAPRRPLNSPTFPQIPTFTVHFGGSLFRRNRLFTFPAKPFATDASNTPTATEQVTTQHSTAQHNTTQHNTTHHSTAQHNTMQHSTAQHSTAQHSTTQHNTVQHNTTQHNTTQHNTIPHGTTKQHSTTGRGPRRRGNRAGIAPVARGVRGWLVQAGRFACLFVFFWGGGSGQR